MRQFCMYGSVRGAGGNLRPYRNLYRMRRVDCRQCGVKVEAVPWGCGKH